MGGMAAGDVASKIAIEKLREILLSNNLLQSNLNDFITELFRDINDSILEAVEREPEFEGMGTTLTVAFIFSLSASARCQRLAWTAKTVAIRP